MTSTRTPKQKTIPLTKQEAELLRYFRASDSDVREMIAALNKSMSERYPVKQKPHLTLVKINSLCGGRNA